MPYATTRKTIGILCLVFAAIHGLMLLFGGTPECDYQYRFPLASVYVTYVPYLWLVAVAVLGIGLTRTERPARWMSFGVLAVSVGLYAARASGHALYGCTEFITIPLSLVTWTGWTIVVLAVADILLPPYPVLKPDQ